MTNRSKRNEVLEAFYDRLVARLPRGPGEIAEIARIAGVSDPTARLHLRPIVEDQAMAETTVLTMMLNELEIVMMGGQRIEADLRKNDDAAADKVRDSYMAAGANVRTRVEMQQKLLVELLLLEDALQGRRPRS